MICVCSHDAGGAEVLASYVRQNNLDCVFSLEGPALSIFERKLGRIHNMPVEKAIKDGESLLCSTGGWSNLEWRAIGLAKDHQKKSIAFLDHWVNYKERFIRNGVLHLPDEIWVGDEIAEKIAKQVFPSILVKLEPNPYFADLNAEIRKFSTDSSIHENEIRVLYVCEPIGEHALLFFGNENYWGYTEETALRYFLDNVHAPNFNVVTLVLRTHPSEPRDKYNWVLKEFDLPIVFDNSRTLLESIMGCDIVVGCESMAMVVGLIAGKRVISSIPPGGKECSLPYPEIERLAR